MKTQIETTTDHQALCVELAQIRYQQEALSAKQRGLEAQLIPWAKEVVATQKGSVVFEGAGAQFTFQRRFEKGKLKTNQDIQYLDEMIEMQKEEAECINKDAIAEVKMQMEKLQFLLDLLSQTDEGRELESERDELALFLKKSGSDQYYTNVLAFKVCLDK